MSDPLENPEAIDHLPGKALLATSAYIDELAVALRAEGDVDGTLRVAEAQRKIAETLGRTDVRTIDTELTRRQVDTAAAAWKTAERLWLDSMKAALPTHVHPALDTWARTQRPQLTRAALLNDDTGQRQP